MALLLMIIFILKKKKVLVEFFGSQGWIFFFVDYYGSEGKKIMKGNFVTIS